MGGPINAAHTAFAHQWKLPVDSRGPTDLANFHMEGDNGNNDHIFDDYRITLVWEEYDGALRGASGSHHIFESGKSSDNRLLKSADLISYNGVGTASTILYNAKDATLFYQTDKRDAVRNSITLSFHLESADDEIRMLIEPAGAVQAEDGPSTLSELVLNNAGPGYSNSFQRLLLSPESLQAITERLSKIRLTPIDPPPASDAHSKLQQQADAYKEDNLAKIPADILAIEHDIIIAGIHPSAENFFGLLCVNARRDVHLPLGWEFLPQDPMDEHRERARKFIRDMPKQAVYARLENYVQAITGSPYSASDLLSTDQLQQLATSIETRAYELLTDGFVDPSHVLNSLPSFVGALGQVLNGEKEWGRFPQMHVTQYDFQVYRTRCLYLFWCADWLAYYNGKTVEGRFMIREVAKEEMDKGRREMVWTARLLVRNWVAWGLFGEALPQEFVIT
ncbi:hypothetical protein BDU57DRAFT_491273 [Ampelomyces quisqualis]|uniref:Uncharacterized protein n=1 Tax=Ampelomyces quisqualis TaxID=50730 RepID=A0A6A5QZB3_AMPQU|nr:hypothetical protein BDU57DRAFT_491273 [Ampelomyces quisqualis]